MRKLSHMPPSAVLLFEDETIVRLFPVLRRAWSLKGKQATVAISGRNAQRVLFGAINLRTGHRIVMHRQYMRQNSFQSFLWLLRHAYRQHPIWLLLDKGGLHVAHKSQALAKLLNITLVWLPKQCPELNAMDHLWRSVKADVSANYQFATIDAHAQAAEQYVRKLTPKTALRKAGILSKNFWLKNLL